MPLVARSSRHRRKVRVTFASLALCCVLTIGLAAWFSGPLVRFAYIRKLASADPQQQLLGIHYVQHHRDDPAVFASAQSLLARCDDAEFDRAVHGLSAAWMWGPRFGDQWVRYLVARTPGATPKHRAEIAAELAKILWTRAPGWDDAHIPAAVGQMLLDPDATVRLNALSAAACLPDSQQARALTAAAQRDPNPLIARHAGLLSRIMRGEPVEPAAAPPPPADAIPQVKQLAALHVMPVGKADLPITKKMPLLIRIDTVRASRLAVPDDLLPAFDSSQPSIRDLATLVALERFTPQQCKQLALTLIGRFDDEQRMAGVILAGMLPPPQFTGDVAKALSIRQDHPGSWIVLEHCRLALAMQGQPPRSFNPAALLMDPKLPRSTVVMALLWMGRLDGTDWLINPLGESPMLGDDGLRIYLDTFSGWPMLRRFLPQCPRVWNWVSPETQRHQVQAIRDWYLLNRHALRFDPATHTFRAPPINREDAKGTKTPF